MTTMIIHLPVRPVGHDVGAYLKLASDLRQHWPERLVDDPENTRSYRLPLLGRRGTWADTLKPGPGPGRPGPLLPGTGRRLPPGRRLDLELGLGHLRAVPYRRAIPQPDQPHPYVTLRHTQPGTADATNHQVTSRRRPASASSPTSHAPRSSATNTTPTNRHRPMLPCQSDKPLPVWPRVLDGGPTQTGDTCTPLD